MNANEIRQKFLDFYAARGHAVIPSASLVPQNDPTTLFTSSGMQPLVPYLLGKEHPEGSRLADSQKSFRSNDIEEVGDNRHTTFFEMLGNWSLGDYFKAEQLPWIFEFLTAEVGLDPAKLFVTVYSGSADGAIPKDEEAIAIWQKLFAGKGIEAAVADMVTEEAGALRGMRDGERIFAYRDKNWWSRAGAPDAMPAGEPGGPDSEIFYDFGTPHDPAFGAECHPNCDCGRFLEIGNSVFMQYVKREDGTFGQLPKRNVDFGGGLERIATAKDGDPDVFTSSLFAPLFAAIERQGGVAYATAALRERRALRIVADHLRAAVFLIHDGVLPSTTDQGYFVRRLLRRAIRYGEQVGVTGLAALVPAIVGAYEGYITLAEPAHDIEAAVREEEERFRATLTRGMREFERLAAADISGRDAFILFSTYGFPLELTQELAAERGIGVDEAGFKEEMGRHQEESRAGSEQKFKGGLADASQETTRLHTTHHLLLRALQMVLGPDVHQRGSNITAERLRLDFSYGEKMTDEQKREVERIVNEKIGEALPVTRSMLPKEEAEKLNAEHEFGAKYPDTVSVYSIGPRGATQDAPRFAEAFSIEFCGGPHVSNTSEIAESGRFRIAKEEASSAGVRRIKGVLE
ncbi:MAG TPA: alanine--tRNA ligase [Candidatus Paceibacterota bacterium]|nr:alanine--tRNA ligase [Candidatus Paceibacterota bacterium]